MEDFARHFGIDVKLLLAQAVNFFVLLWLLKRYAYKPLLRMMARRRDEIQHGIRSAKESEEKLARIGIEREEVLKGARGEALAIVKKGELSAEERKAAILKDAAQKTKEVIEEAHRKIREEEAKMRDSVLKNSERLVRETITRVLGKLPPDIRDEELIRDAIKETKGVTREI